MRLSWLRSLFISPGAPLTDEWRKSHAAESLKAGWDGPRWRTPKERADMMRQERRAAMRVVPDLKARAK
ncbi:MAG: hypothetical protein NUW22_05015 [Acidobacteria bacterium]|nr:hypothetical protein [Acidobacteriota bacterium]